MEKYFGNYLGICINNQDPENRGRVQVFIPHILPSLYRGWNEAGLDISFNCVGNNLPDGLSNEVVEKLIKMLPWAEAAMPVIGSSVAGSYNLETGNFNQTNTPESIATSINLNTAANAFALNGDPNSPGIIADNVKLTFYSSTQETNDPGTIAGLGNSNNVLQPGIVALSPDLQKQYGLKNGDVVSLTLNTGVKHYGYVGDTTSSRLTNRFDIYLPGGSDSQLASTSGSGSLGTLRLEAAAPQRLTGKELDSQGLALLQQVTGRSGLTKIDINDPASAPDASAVGSSDGPFKSSEPYLVQSQPNQDAITQINAPTPVTVDTSFGTNIWTSRVNNRFPGVTNNCGVRARLFDYAVTGDTYFQQGLSVTGNNVGGYASRSIDYWVNSGYYQLTEQPPQTIPFGTKIIFQNNKSGTNAGHVTTVADGKLLGSGSNESWSDYARLNNNEATFLVPTEKYADLFREKYNSNLPTYNFTEVTRGGTAVADDGGNDVSSNIVKNTTETTAVPLDTTGMAQGMFGIPGPGAMLWVFFREGDPLFPVYFAASYGATEWQSAYKASSPAPYGPQENNSNSISNQAVFRPNNAGALTFTGAVNSEKDSRAVRMAHANGGYLELHPYGTVHYSPNEHLEQVAGTNYSYCLNREEWTQGDSNKVVIGNQWVVVGNPSQANIETIEKLTEKVKQINAEMLKN